MTPVFSRKSVLFLCLGVFALLFGIVQGASAVTCSSYGGNPNWQRGGNPSIDDCTAVYTDPIGGSNLTVCQYRVLSNGVVTTPASPGLSDGWRNDAVGTCSGSSATLSMDVSIGAGLNCRDEGENTCEVQFKAEDNSGNSATGTIVTLDVDYTFPTVNIKQASGQVDPTNASPINFTVVFSESVTGFAGSDVSFTESSAGGTLVAAVTPSSGTTYNVAVSGMASSGTVIVTIPAGRATDDAGNGNTASTSTDNTVTYDINPPTVASVNSTAANGNYTVGAGIPVTVTFSKSVTVTGTPRLTLATGGAGVAVNYTSGSPGTTLTFQYTVAIGHNSSDLDYTSTSALALNGGTIKDTLGNNAVLTLAFPGSANSLGANKAIVVDTIAPVVTSFTINGTGCSGNPCTANPITTKDALDIAWATNDDAGGSGIQKYEVWRAPDNGVWACIIGIGCPVNRSAIPAGETDNPAEGIYWYGVHVIDNVNNCISEDTSGADKGHACGGVASDSLDATREDKGPIKVVMDKTPPVTALTSVAGDASSPYWDKTNNSGTDIVVAGEVDMLCRWGDVDAVYSAMPSGNSCPVPVSGSTATCSFSLPQLASYTKHVSCRDVAGNEQPTNSALATGNEDVTFGVDWTAPSGSVLINGGATYTTSTSVTLGLTCTDSVSLCDKMRFSNDGASFSTEEAFAVSKSWALTSGDGIKTVYARYKDKAGTESGSLTDTIILDTIAPSKPTCTPAGGPFQNKANNVTCSAESGATIRYTLTQNGSSPDPSSTLYSSPFDIASTAILTVAAWDTAGNRSTSPDTSYSFTILHNGSPSIQGNPGASPDPIKASAQVTFSVTWNDPDAGDVTRIHICKTDSISAPTQTCSGGSWCDSASFSSSSPTACNGTSPASSGSQSYYAFVCDDENECSSSKSGTFLTDATAPTVSLFTVEPNPADPPPNWVNNVSPDATVTWIVSDSGGANLKQIEVWRAWDENGDKVQQETEWNNPGNGQSNPLCTKTGGPPKCTNDQNFDTTSTDSDSYIDSNLAASSVYWYGIHVVDKADNMGTESTPLKVQVDKNEPNSQIQSPVSSSWFSNDFALDTLDEDLLSGLDTAQCQYKIIPFEDTNGDGTADTERTSSGWLSRTCNAPPSAPVTTITVGSADYCKYQAKSSCWVYIRSKDVAGNLHTPTQPAGSVKLYHIDWTQPQPGKLYITANEGDQVYPIQVQLDRSDTYKVHVTDNLKVTGCSLYIDGIDQGAMTPIVPGCETGCTFTKDFTFTGTGTYHNNYATCKDAANNSKSGTSVDVEVETLSVGLTAIPSSGSMNTLFDLVATVSGTMTGIINYKFDCTNDGTWELEITPDPVQNPYTALDLCQYASPSTYTAKVFVERGVGTAEDTVNIPVSANSLPSANNLQHNNATADYCFVSSPPVILSWQFSDQEDGSSQSAYRVQIATNPGFGSPTDTCPQGEESGTCTAGHGAQQYAPPSLAYATTYYWRVKVRDSAGDFSSSWATGPSFTTPSHPYPVPNFTWSPALPGAQESVQFCSRTGGACPTNVTTFAPGSTGQSFSWNFADPDSGVNNTSTVQNPSHTFTKTGAFGVTLQAGDDVGSCSNSQTVNVSVPFPEWQEISPF